MIAMVLMEDGVGDGDVSLGEVRGAEVDPRAAGGLGPGLRVIMTHPEVREPGVHAASNMANNRGC